MLLASIKSRNLELEEFSIMKKNPDLIYSSDEENEHKVFSPKKNKFSIENNNIKSKHQIGVN